MNKDEDNLFSSERKRGWWSRMSRHEQIVAAIIGAVVTGIFGVLIALISSSSGPFNGNRPSAGSSSSAPIVSSPTTSGAGTMPTSPSPASPRSPDMQYLANLTPVSNSGNFDTGNATVSGNSYLNSVILDMALGGSYSVSYNIERQWHVLKATVGLQDDSPQNEEYEFQVFADGRPIYSHLFTLGQSQHIRLNIVGVLRLELRATLSSSAFFGEAHGVWGNAYLAR
jgi:hypothetical protein